MWSLERRDGTLPLSEQHDSLTVPTTKPAGGVCTDKASNLNRETPRAKNVAWTLKSTEARRAPTIYKRGS